MTGTASRPGVFWFLPTHGDGRHLGTSHGGRRVDIQYLRQVAQAADHLGYEGVLLPTGKSCEDSWVIASALVTHTEQLKFLVAVRPGLQSPTVAARMVATLDRISGGRLPINIVTGGNPIENQGDGLFLDHDARYELTEEFLVVFKRLLAGEHVTFEGKHLRIVDGHLLFPPVQTPHPALYFGGSSDQGTAIAARTIDKYLTWGEPPGLVGEKIYVNTQHGIRTVDPQLVEMARTCGMTPLSLFRRVYLPGALPSIFVGLRHALGIMWLTLIVAETIVATTGLPCSRAVRSSAWRLRAPWSTGRACSCSTSHSAHSTRSPGSRCRSCSSSCGSTSRSPPSSSPTMWPKPWRSPIAS